jgi:hypothetical protein
MTLETLNPDQFLDAKGLSAYMTRRGVSLTPATAKSWFDRKKIPYQTLPNGVRAITIGRLEKHLADDSETPPVPPAPKKPRGRRRRNHI